MPRRPASSYVTTTIESTTRSGYYPGAKPIAVKLLAERGSGRLLGGQIVGEEGAAKRIDVVAVALHAGFTAQDLVDADLSYAPPFSPLWDPVAVGRPASCSGALTRRRQSAVTVHTAETSRERSGNSVP